LGDINIHNLLNESERVDSNAVLMRIQNSFTPLMPLISSNADFQKNINVGDISNFEVRLVDANLKDVHLLSPMWVSFTLREREIDKEKDMQDFWQYQYFRPPRQPLPPSKLIPLNKEILKTFNYEPISGTT
jgi:hypothetical protein